MLENYCVGLADDSYAHESDCAWYYECASSATSLLKSAGVSAPLVQELIGHKSAEMNEHYTHIDIVPLREATERLPNL